jgi:hypothetical protein
MDHRQGNDVYIIDNRRKLESLAERVNSAIFIIVHNISDQLTCPANSCPCRYP